jgi:hypothetical protein
MGPDHQEVVVLTLGEKDFGGVTAILHLGLSRDARLLGEPSRLVERLLQLLLGVVGTEFEAGVDGDETEAGLRRRERNSLPGRLGAAGISFNPAKNACEWCGRRLTPLLSYSQPSSAVGVRLMGIT